MHTEPQWRRKGIASRILREAIRWAKKRGYREVLLHASPLGKGVYHRRGFRNTSEMRLELA
jgi:GNAT superfamily N-acetyltransferase